MKHVNKGCILVDSTKLCQSDGAAPISSGATVYGRFDGNNPKPIVTPGCKIIVNFPSSYGDIYYGVDDCIYDSTGTCGFHGANQNVLADRSDVTIGANFGGQCCVQQTSDTVENVYAG